MFLPELEKQPNNLFFIRPHRFGKSIFLSMLYSYYDCNQKDKFGSLFGDLWIGKHPTPLQGTYQVLFLDFSQITGKIDVLEERFNAYMSINLDAFVRRYAQYYQEEKEEIFSKTEYADKIELIFKVAITHADGFYRDVFKKFKGNFERIFMMGVSSVTLDDVTSDYNVGWNISVKPEFDEMLGFSTKDVVEMFSYYKKMGSIPADSDVEAIVDEFKQWYANYQFDENWQNKHTEMFNVIFVYYFYWEYSSTGKAPEQYFNSEHKDVCLKMM